MLFASFRFNRVQKEKPFQLPLTTSYKRDYDAAFENICTKNTIRDATTHDVWNRLPLNDFAVKRLVASEFKFMDDHLFNMSQARKNINFIRQIRNRHIPLV